MMPNQRGAHESPNLPRDLDHQEGLDFVKRAFFGPCNTLLTKDIACDYYLASKIFFYN